jgi:predicted permease
VALFTNGAVLVRPAGAKPMPWLNWQTGGVDMVLTAVKLLVHPLWVLALAWLLVQAGLPLPAEAWSAAVLVAALPSASNSALLAERFGADSARITRVILLTTVLAFPSFSAWVAFFKS